jgi:transposase
MVPIELLEQALAQNALLLARIDALTAQLQALTAQLETRKSRKKVLPAEPHAPRQPSPETEGRPQPPPKPEATEAAPPRTRTPKARPELPLVDEAVRPDRCAHCGGARLSNKDTDDFELIDYVAGYLRKRRVRRTRCRCADCAQLTTPVIPGACLPKTHYTAGFIAWILYSKYALHLPLERQRRDLARMGHPMTNAQLSDLVQRALSELSGVAKVLLKAVLAGDRCHSDATGLPVLTSEKDRTHLGQMFVFGWDRVAAFSYAPDKKGGTFAAMVSDFQGTMVLDASSSHLEALSTGRIVWAGCNAHGLRKFREAKESDPALGAEGERWISSWFDQERHAKEQGLKGHDLLAWRQRHIGPLVEGFESWLAAVHPTVLPKTPLAEATRYYVHHGPALKRFLADPLVPLDNNFAERCLRPQALGRNNWQFAGSHQAAHHTAVAYTLVQTARLHGLDVLAYLVWVLERVAACRDGGALYADLTPSAYEEAQERRTEG